MDASRRTNPFPGLRPFRQEEADLFFGRDRQSDELVRRLASRRFLAVVGASGSGKSSLVRAGLLPSLESGFMAEAGTQWRIATLRPQDDPIGFLAQAIVETGRLAHLDLAAPAAKDVVETTLRRSSLGLVEIARLVRRSPYENLLILVDQFEELFRFAELTKQRDAGNDAPAFVKLLLGAAQQTDVPVYVVITMRSDFLGDCDRFRGLPEAISDSQYLIPRLTRDELQAVITGPVGVRGGRIAPSLVQRLLNDVGDDMDQLPILQHALMRAWDRWERHDPDLRAIDLNDLSEIGGMAEALSRHADDAFGALPNELDRHIAERLFKCLTERGADNREIRRPTSLSRVSAIASTDAADVIRVVDVFRAPDRSFLMPPHDVALDNDSVLDISHESLIRQWKRLRTWVQEEAESRATYVRVVDAARLRRDGKGGLWGEPDLTYARQWQAREAPNPAWAERYAAGFEDALAFLRESEVKRAAELAQEQQRLEAERIGKERELEQAKALADAQRQRADEQAAAAIRQRRLTRGLAVILLLAVGAAGFGGYQSNLARKGLLIAEQQRRIAETETRLAETNASEARKQKAAAEASSVEAGHQKGVAEENAARAEAQREAADQERQRAETLQRVAEDQGRLALSRQLAAQANQKIGREPRLALLLGAAGLRTAPTIEARQNLQRAFTGNPHLRAFLSRNEGGESDRGRSSLGHRIAFSPDGRTVAAEDDNSSVILWDVASRTPLGEPLNTDQVEVLSVAFSPDGRTLASAGKNGTVILWDVARRKPLGDPLKGHQGLVWQVAFSPDGQTLASASIDDSIILWNVASRKPLGEPLNGHQSVRERTGSAVQGIAFSPDGKTLASASADKTVMLWDVTSRKPLGEPLNGHQNWVWSVAFSPDGKTLASASEDHTVILWDVASHKHVGEPLKGHQSSVRSVAFSPDGKTLVSSSDEVILWDVASREPIGEPLTAHQGTVNSVAFSPDGKTLASASFDYSVILWSVARGHPLGESLTGAPFPAQSVAFSPSGQTLASASADKADKTVILWNVASRTRLGEPFKGHGYPVLSLGFSPDGKTLASSSEDWTVILWDVATRRPLGELLHGDRGAVVSVAFSPDGKILASGSMSGTVILWDVASRKPLGDPIDGHHSYVESVAFHPDGTTLASGGWDGTVALWDVASRKPLGEPIKAHRFGVRSVAFSPDGKTLASASEDGTITLWDVVSRKRLGEPLKGHRGSVRSLAFSADSRTLASGSEDDTVMLWDVASRKGLSDPLTEGVARRESGVLSIAFSRDGKTLASAGRDRSVTLWDVDVESWIRRACAIANRNLTRVEWEQYLGYDLPYRATCPELPVPRQ